MPVPATKAATWTVQPVTMRRRQGQRDHRPRKDGASNDLAHVDVALFCVRRSRVARRHDRPDEGQEHDDRDHAEDQKDLVPAEAPQKPAGEAGEESRSEGRPHAREAEGPAPALVEVPGHEARRRGDPQRHRCAREQRRQRERHEIRRHRRQHHRDQQQPHPESITPRAYPLSRAGPVTRLDAVSESMIRICPNEIDVRGASKAASRAREKRERCRP